MDTVRRPAPYYIPSLHPLTTFATPLTVPPPTSPQVRRVVGQIITHGRVVRPTLGVDVAEDATTRRVAQSLRRTLDGALVVEVCCSPRATDTIACALHVHCRCTACAPHVHCMSAACDMHMHMCMHM